MGEDKQLKNEVQNVRDTCNNQKLEQSDTQRFKHKIES